MDMMKKCSTCKEVFEISFFSKNAARHDGLSNICKVCRAAWRRQNPEQNRKDVKAWKERCKEGKCFPEYVRLNRRRHEKQRYKRAIIELRDCYIKDLLCDGTSLKPKDIPQEMVDLKRTHLKIHRQLKK
jgi:hypothetical protein